jgi:hypothetical protein
MYKIHSGHQFTIDAAHSFSFLKRTIENCQTSNILISTVIHRKKSFSIFPSPAGMSLTKLSLGGNNLYMTPLFPPRESLVSAIPAGDGNIEKYFLRCTNVSFALLNGWNVTETGFDHAWAEMEDSWLWAQTRKQKVQRLQVECTMHARIAQIITDYAIPLTTMQLEPCEKLEGSHSQNRFPEAAPDWSVCSWGGLRMGRHRIFATGFLRRLPIG